MIAKFYKLNGEENIKAQKPDFFRIVFCWKTYVSLKHKIRHKYVQKKWDVVIINTPKGKYCFGKE